MDDTLRNKMQKWHGSNWNTDVRTILPDILEYITERDDGRGLPPFGYYIGSPFMDQVSPEDFERGLEMLCEKGKMRKFENWNGGILYTTSGCEKEKNEEENLSPEDILQKLEEMESLLGTRGLDNDDKNAEEPDSDLYRWTFTEGKRITGKKWSMMLPDSFVCITPEESREFQAVPSEYKTDDPHNSPICLMAGQHEYDSPIPEELFLHHPKARAEVASVVGMKFAEFAGGPFLAITGTQIETLGIAWGDLCSAIMIAQTGNESLSVQCIIWSGDESQHLRVQTQSMSEKQQKNLIASVKEWLNTFKFTKPNRFLKDGPLIDREDLLFTLMQEKPQKFYDAIGQCVKEANAAYNLFTQRLNHYAENKIVPMHGIDMVREGLSNAIEVQLDYAERIEAILEKLRPTNPSVFMMKKIYKKLEPMHFVENEARINGEDIIVDVPIRLTEILDSWKNEEAQIVKKAEEEHIKKEKERAKKQEEERLRKEKERAELLRKEKEREEEQKKELEAYTIAYTAWKEECAAISKLRNTVLSEVLECEIKKQRRELIQKRKRENTVYEEKKNSLKQKYDEAAHTLEKAGLLQFTLKREARKTISCMEEEMAALQENEKLSRINYRRELEHIAHNIRNNLDKYRLSIEKQLPFPEEPLNPNNRNSSKSDKQKNEQKNDVYWEQPRVDFSVPTTYQEEMETEKKEEEAIREKRPQNKKRITIIILLLLGLIAWIIYGYIDKIPDRAKAEAAELANAGDYMAAVALLDDLNMPEEVASNRKTYIEKMESEIRKAIQKKDIRNALALIDTYTVLTTREKNIAAVQAVCSHNLKETERMNATCTDNGYSRKLCDTCGYENEEILTAPGHNHKLSFSCESTCTVNGKYTYTCSVCGDAYTQTLDLLAHSYSASITREPTCTAEGERVYTCAGCGVTKTEAIALIAHENTEQITRAATCSMEGLKQCVCTVCGKKESEVSIPLLAHTYKDTVLQEATCVQQGQKQAICVVCGANGETTVLSALGHSYVQMLQQLQNCTEQGTYLYTCSRCGDSYTQPIPENGHTWLAATCTEAKKCKMCGTMEGEALGHKWARMGLSTNVRCARCDNKPIVDVIMPESFTDTSSYGTASIIATNPVVEYSSDGYLYSKITIESELISGTDYTGIFYVYLYDENNNMISDPKQTFIINLHHSKEVSYLTSKTQTITINAMDENNLPTPLPVQENKTYRVEIVPKS